MRSDRPLIMGILNANGDSFSDGGAFSTMEAQRRRLDTLILEGADIIDIGAQTASTSISEISIDQELERLLPILLEAIGTGVRISVDTYRSEVADAAISAGAAIVNDYSGLNDRRMADTMARNLDRSYVLTHNIGKPKKRVTETSLYSSVAGDVLKWFRLKSIELAKRGVAATQLIYDPGIDLSKTPRQTVEVLHGLSTLHALGRPILLGVSRKDFIGAITRTTPAKRLPGTLATVGFAASADLDLIVRVHDVGATRDFLTVLQALDTPEYVHPDLRLEPQLYREPMEGGRPNG